MNRFLQVLVLLAGVSLIACTGPEAPGLAPPVITDTGPVGEGLKTMAYALLGAAVVLVLGRLLRVP